MPGGYTLLELGIVMAVVTGLLAVSTAALSLAVRRQRTLQVSWQARQGAAQLASAMRKDAAQAQAARVGQTACEFALRAGETVRYQVLPTALVREQFIGESLVRREQFVLGAVTAEFTREPAAPRLLALRWRPSAALEGGAVSSSAHAGEVVLRLPSPVGDLPVEATP